MTLKDPPNPVRPRKPVPPQKGITERRHKIDIDKMFHERTFYKTKIVKGQYLREECSEDEADEHEDVDLAVSLETLMTLVPKGIQAKDVFMTINTSESDMFTNINSVEVWYETPIDYDTEMKKYQEDCVKYNAEFKLYKEVQLPAWKTAYEVYRSEKKKEKELEKKKELEEQLAAIKNQLKQMP